MCVCEFVYVFVCVCFMMGGKCLQVLGVQLWFKKGCIYFAEIQCRECFATKHHHVSAICDMMHYCCTGET